MGRTWTGGFGPLAPGEDEVKGTMDFFQMGKDAVTGPVHFCLGGGEEPCHVIWKIPERNRNTNTNEGRTSCDS